MIATIDRFHNILISIAQFLGILSEARHATDRKALIGLNNVQYVNKLACRLCCKIGNTLHKEIRILQNGIPKRSDKEALIRSGCCQASMSLKG